jgi:PAS domain S-box-containing protein
MSVYSNTSNKNQIHNSKILLLINNKSNVNLLSKFLGNDYITYKEYNESIKYDMILIDTYNYKTNYKLIKQIKDMQNPLFLPVILMHKREDPVDYSSKMSNIADEHFLTPVKKDVLKTRIQRMLKTRELTKENYKMTNKYKKIFNNINDMVFLHRIDLENHLFYTFVEINQKVLDKTGYSKKELLDMKPIDLVPYKKSSPLFNYYFNKLSKNNEVIVETELIKKNGEIMNVEINSKIIELESKIMILSVLRDLN